MMAMRRFLATATAAALLSQGVSANPLFIFEGLHKRLSINSVNYDGNTCTWTPKMWNPPAASNTFFLVYWAAPVSPNGNRGHYSNVFWVQNGNWKDGNAYPPLIVAQVYELENLQLGEADLVTSLANHQLGGYLEATTVGAPIPRNSKWHLVAEAFNTLTGQGAYGVIEQGGAYATFGALSVYEHYGAFTMDWTKITDIYVGCDNGYYGGKNSWLNQPVMEFYLDVSHDLGALPNAIGTRFATPEGFAVGTSVYPSQHDCSAPTGLLPNMCQNGNANAWVNGVGSAPGLFAYMLTELSGVLTTPPDPPGDGCDLRGIGDGCLP